MKKEENHYFQLQKLLQNHFEWGETILLGFSSTYTIRKFCAFVKMFFCLFILYKTFMAGSLQGKGGEFRGIFTPFYTIKFRGLCKSGGARAPAAPTSSAPMCILNWYEARSKYVSCKQTADWYKQKVEYFWISQLILNRLG